MSALKRKRASSGIVPANPESSVMRASLETSLVELRATVARLESLLSALPSASSPHRAALREVVAPAQSHTSSQQNQQISGKTCPSCADLRAQLATLRAQASEHARERDAWRAFKTWWLASLDRRERKRASRRSQSSSTKRLPGEEHSAADRARGSTRPSAAGASGRDTRGEEGEEERLRRVLGTLDAETRQVWREAGIVADSMEGREGEESELALPLHAPPKVAAADRTGAASDEREGDGARSAVGMPAGEEPNSKAGNDRDIGDDAAASATAVRAGRIDAANRVDGTASPRNRTVANRAPSTSATRTPTARSNGTHSPRLASTSTTTRPTPTTTRPTPTTARPTAAYIDSTPIRNAHLRRTLLSSDCPDCALFYSHLDAATSTGAGEAERAACSRHRSTFQRAETPEGYWNIGFPDTQEAQRVNAVARRARAEG